MYTQCVALLALYVGLAHCFSWDIVMGGKYKLHFFKNGIQIHQESIMSAAILKLTYDPVLNRVLFSKDVCVISSFDIATKQIQTLVSSETCADNFDFTYDPASETVFWIELYNINSYSSKRGSSNAVDGNLLIKLDEWPKSIAVDSCGGYIYWTTDSYIERARFDGSDREVVINSTVLMRPDLTIDQQTQKIYWIDKYDINNNMHLSIVSADFNGKNIKTLYSDRTSIRFGTITVSKDYIYWRGQVVKTYWQLPKNQSHYRDGEAKEYSVPSFGFCEHCESIAANYKLEEITQGLQHCEALTSLLPSTSSNVPTDASQLCVHGTQIIGESVCNCTQGYTGDRCDVSLCQNYCLHGDCSVSDEQPKCRCNVGYSGDRCEINVCQGYCLNNGVCTTNEDSEPICQCAGDYEGDRCDVSVSVVLMNNFNTFNFEGHR